MPPCRSSVMSTSLSSSSWPRIQVSIRHPDPAPAGGRFEDRGGQDGRAQAVGEGGEPVGSIAAYRCVAVSDEYVEAVLIALRMAGGQQHVVLRLRRQRFGARGTSRFSLRPPTHSESGSS